MESYIKQLEQDLARELDAPLLAFKEYQTFDSHLYKVNLVLDTLPKKFKPIMKYWISDTRIMFNITFYVRNGTTDFDNVTASIKYWSLSEWVHTEQGSYELYTLLKSNMNYEKQPLSIDMRTFMDKKIISIDCPPVFLKDLVSAAKKTLDRLYKDFYQMFSIYTDPYISEIEESIHEKNEQLGKINHELVSLAEKRNRYINKQLKIIEDCN